MLIGLFPDKTHHHILRKCLLRFPFFLYLSILFVIVFLCVPCAVAVLLTQHCLLLLLWAASLCISRSLDRYVRHFDIDLAFGRIIFSILIGHSKFFGCTKQLPIKIPGVVSSDCVTPMVFRSAVTCTIVLLRALSVIRLYG